jgi:soluble lytic murein transglycosylase-like protein
MRPGRALSVVFGTLALVGASAAGAQVIEIGDDGSATTYDKPAVFTSEGVRSLVPDRPAATSNLSELFTATANRHALDPKLLEAVAWTESRFHQAAISPKGAVGVMQLMEGTARGLGVDRYDLHGNIDGGAAYLDQLLTRYRGGLPLALAAYNAGPGAVDRYGGVPPYAETQAYVRTVLNRMGGPATLSPVQMPYPSVILIAP